MSFVQDDNNVILLQYGPLNSLCSNVAIWSYVLLYQSTEELIGYDYRDSSIWLSYI